MEAYLEAIANRFVPDELFGSVLSKIRHHYLVHAVLPILPSLEHSSAFVQLVEDRTDFVVAIVRNQGIVPDVKYISKTKYIRGGWLVNTVHYQPIRVFLSVCLDVLVGQELLSCTSCIIRK